MWKSTTPPRTKRYCLMCEQVRKFEYNSGTGHSECVECGCRKAVNPSDMKIDKKDLIFFYNQTKNQKQ